ITSLALDTPPFPPTRLPDLSVTDEGRLVDGGTVIVQPASVLYVDVFDADGAPVPQHEVFVEEIRPLSPLTIRPVHTNFEGRATFDSLSAGRYRVRTTATARCDGTLLSVAPMVTVPRAGTTQIRLVVSGRATFRIVSQALGPMRGILVTASPETVSPP